MRLHGWGLGSGSCQSPAEQTWGGGYQRVGVTTNGGAGQVGGTWAEAWEEGEIRVGSLILTRRDTSPEDQGVS